MIQTYFNPERELDPYALPDCEIFYVNEVDAAANAARLDDPSAGDYCSEAGWYWQACFPGCFPDGDPVGPFATYAAALADAQSCSDSD